MLNENCGRYRTLVKNIEADSNEVLAVTLGEIRYRPNKSSFRLTEFRSSFEPGDPPRHLVRVAARGEGESTLRCMYARPWDTEAAEVRTYVVRVELS